MPAIKRLRAGALLEAGTCGTEEHCRPPLVLILAITRGTLISPQPANAAIEHLEM